jgi:hypothetical protein
MVSQPIGLSTLDIHIHTEKSHHLEEFENLFLYHSNHIEDVFAIQNHFYLEPIKSNENHSSKIFFSYMMFNQHFKDISPMNL